MSAWEHVRKGVGALLEAANGSHASNMVGPTLETPGEDNGLISRVEDLRDGRWKSVERCATWMLPVLADKQRI